eukprot:PITA_34324
MDTIRYRFPLKTKTKTTFTCSWGTFAYRVLPFGLCNAPATFQRAILSIFADLINEGLEVYMDEFTPYGDDFNPALDTLEKVLQRCIVTKLCLSHEKFYMMMTEGLILGHYISAAGIQVDPAKIQILLLIPTPTTQTEVHSFLGFSGYYRRFIEHYSHIAALLYALTGKVDFLWTEKCEHAFKDLKKLEFDITVKDRPGKENPVVDFLSRMPKPVDATAVEDQFPDEHLYVVVVKTPWYADVSNYLAVGANMHIKRCIREDEIFDILKACHDGPCGGHFSNRRIGYKVLQIGYYWPTIFKDAKKFVQACDSCQRAGRPEYVTKWVEAKALPRATKDSVIQFLFHLFVRYGLLREIITDGGPQFAGNRIVATLNNYHVQHKITTPYHPRANGQVESSNKIIEAILTKTIASHRRDWDTKLPEALWAYRTTWRSTTGYSPYQLLFGKQPIFPIEFEIQTL